MWSSLVQRIDEYSDRPQNRSHLCPIQAIYPCKKFQRSEKNCYKILIFHVFFLWLGKISWWDWIEFVVADFVFQIIYLLKRFKDVVFRIIWPQLISGRECKNKFNSPPSCHHHGLVQKTIFGYVVGDKCLPQKRIEVQRPENIFIQIVHLCTRTTCIREAGGSSFVWSIRDSGKLGVVVPCWQIPVY